MNGLMGEVYAYLHYLGLQPGMLAVMTKSHKNNAISSLKSTFCNQIYESRFMVGLLWFLTAHPAPPDMNGSVSS